VIKARLKPSLSFNQAQAQMPALTDQFIAQATPTQKQQGAGFIRLDRLQNYLASDYRTTFQITGCNAVHHAHPAQGREARAGSD
jgi:hypothetical protein